MGWHWVGERGPEMFRLPAGAHVVSAREARKMEDERITISVPEAGVLLGIGTTKAWEMSRRGELPGMFRVGRSVRVSVEVLRRWVEEQATRGAKTQE